MTLPSVTLAIIAATLTHTFFLAAVCSPEPSAGGGLETKGDQKDSFL